MKYYLLILSLVFLFSCQSRTNEASLERGTVRLTGFIKQMDDTPQMVSISYGTLGERKLKSAIADSSGRFEMDFEIFHPQDVILKFEKGRGILYVEPQDEISLGLNAKAFKKEDFPDFEITGDHAAITREIMGFTRFRRSHPKSFAPDYRQLSPEAYVSLIKKRVDHEDSLLSVFSEEADCHPTFLSWAEKEIRYRNADYLVDFLMLSDLSPGSFEAALYDQTLFPADDHEAFICSWYHMFLNNYSRAHYMINDSVFQSRWKAGHPDSASRYCLDRIILDQEPGLSREVMCYQILSGSMDEVEDFHTASEWWGNPDPYVTDPALSGLLQGQVEARLSASNAPIALLDGSGKRTHEITGDFFTNLRKRHEGKVLYIDIWATWCGPCRDDIPYSLKLQDHFKGEPVVFVNLCLSSNKADWKQSIRDLHISGENYYFDHDQSDLIRDKLQFRGFPTYMIVDGKGRIVNRQAPRPSNGDEVIQALEQQVRKLS